MENLFKTETHEIGAIIRDEKALLHQPTKINPLLREQEIREIVEAIRPLTKNLHGENLFIHGPCGNGKKVVLDYIMTSLRKQTKRVVPVWVNCGKYSTQMGVYSKIIESLGMPIPRRGWAADEVFNRIRERIDQDNISILLVLDNVHRLIMRGEAELFNSISLANEGARARFGLIGLSYNEGALDGLSEQIRTAFGFTILEFGEYSVENLTAILEERAHMGLVDGSWSFNILENCARIGKASRGNASVALDILWKAGRHAERRGSKCIEMSDIEAVYSGKDYVKITLENACALFEVNGFKMTEDEKLALRIIAEKGEMASSDFYDEFRAIRMVGKRQLRFCLNSLEAMGAIKTETVDRWGIMDEKRIYLQIWR